MTARPRSSRAISLLGLALVVAVALPGVVQAQTSPLRDPTLPPHQVMQPAPQGQSVAATESVPVFMDSVAVIVRDTVPYLVFGTRLYAVGDQLENYRIERITETEIWLRRGKELQKLNRFGPIQRRSVAPDPVLPAQP